jgi:hypothetical protein
LLRDGGCSKQEKKTQNGDFHVSSFQLRGVWCELGESSVSTGDNIAASAVGVTPGADMTSTVVKNTANVNRSTIVSPSLLLPQVMQHCPTS